MKQPEDAGLYLEGVFETWAAGNRHQWTLDIWLLSTRYGIRTAPTETERNRLIPLATNNARNATPSR